MMKVCVVGPSKYFFSGLTAHTIFLANALSEKNEVSVVLLRKLLPRFLYPGKEHIDRSGYLIDFAGGIEIYEGMDWDSPKSWFGAYKFLKQHKPDAIIMLWWTPAVAHMQLFLAWTNKLRVGASLILEMHETMGLLEERIFAIRLYSRIAGRLLMRRADAFTTQSTSAKEQVSQIYKIDADKICVVPIGLYEDYKRCYDKNSVKKELGIEEKFVILSFGSIRKYKGNSYLVRAFSSLPESIAGNSRLVIAGEDWGDDAELGKLIESSPYRHKITFNPHFVPDEMVPKYFSAADIVSLPYLSTSGSGVAHIAMAYGKPIITSDLETMREALADYQGAMFASVTNSLAIKDKLLEIYERHVAGDIITFDPPQNTWDKIARQYEQIIDKLAK